VKRIHLKRIRLRRLSVRLLTFNLLLLFLPLASMLYLDTYEQQLLDMQEDSMIQQARIFASALDSTDLAAEAGLILGRLGGRIDSRIRVVNRSGSLLADSSSLTLTTKPTTQAGASPSVTSSSLPERVETASDPNKAEDTDSQDTRVANERALYRTVVYPLNVLRRLFLPPGEPYDSGEFYSGRTTLLGPEVLAALEGRYGAVTRLSTGGQVSVNLYSAIPIRGADDGEIVGAVLVSRSTYGILRKLYELRLDIIRIFLFSLAAALLLSLVLSQTITIPIAKLQKEAGNVLDSSGRFRGRFTGLRRRDEIGDLSRALSELSGRLEKRIAFIDGFTADLLHELKNPLAAIRGSVELALDPAAEPLSGADRSLLLRIRDEELRMERLLSRLREISRVDNDMAGEATEAIDLALLVPAILSRYPHKDFPTVRVEFVNETKKLATVRVNPDRLVQLLVNPVDNAVSFSPPDTLVLVRLRPDTVNGLAGYTLAVEDKGPGVSEASLPHVFDRFYTDRPTDGSLADDHAGLGLAIVKAIATAYGGSCTLVNTGGGGCRFELGLPAILNQ
jgi:two-component system sensor histidine kinase ChvG